MCPTCFLPPIFFIKLPNRDSQHQHASTVSPVCPFLYCIPSCMHITQSHPSVSVCLLSNCPYRISKLGNSLLNLEFCVWYPFVSSGDDKKLPSSSKVLGSVPCLLYCTYTLIHCVFCLLFIVYCMYTALQVEIYTTNSPCFVHTTCLQ